MMGWLGSAVGYEYVYDVNAITFMNGWAQDADCVPSFFE